MKHWLLSFHAKLSYMPALSGSMLSDIYHYTHILLHQGVFLLSRHQNAEITQLDLYRTSNTEDTLNTGILRYFTIAILQFPTSLLEGIAFLRGTEKHVP